LRGFFDGPRERGFAALWSLYHFVVPLEADFADGSRRSRLLLRGGGAATCPTGRMPARRPKGRPALAGFEQARDLFGLSLPRQTDCFAEASTLTATAVAKRPSRPA